MLERAVIEAADALVHSVGAKKAVLTVADNSLLQPLVSLSLPISPEEEENNYHMAIVELCAGRKDFEGNNQHGLYLTDVMHPVSVGAAAATAMARNLVNPIISELTEAFNLGMADRNFNITEPTVIIDTLPAVYRNKTFLSLVESFSESTASRFDMTKGDVATMFPSDVPVEVLTGMVKTNIASVDKLIESLLINVSTSDLRNIYLSAFAPRAVHDIEILNSRSEISAIVLFLMANYLRQNYLDNTNGQTSRVDEVTSSIRLFAARQILQIITKRDSMIRNDRMINTVTDYGTHLEVSVNGEVYIPKFIKKGGSPEILLGAVMRGDRNVSIEVLLENGTYYHNVWKQDRTIRERKLNNDKATAYYLVLSSIMQEFINNEDNSERCNYVYEQRGEFHAATKRFLDNNNLREGQCLEKFIRLMICTVLFYDQQYLHILESIDELMESDENLSVMEAATIAQLNLTVDWLFEGVILDKA